MDYIIYATFVVIFISMGTVVILYSSHIRAKAWAALSLDSKKNIAEAAVTYAALTNIKRKAKMIKLCRYIAVATLLLSFISNSTSNGIGSDELRNWILFLGNTIFTIALIVEVSLNAYVTKVAKNTVPSVLSGKQAKMIWRLYVMSRIFFVIGCSAGSLLTHSVFS
ncbi:hypothetical protein [Lacticaseibacillus paracasei]|uniref:Integral membrane protein n=1 Tax=Lacticaseibacillus paracasei TaxID=1597 RepID=A0AAW6A2B5_LACPA|nr:hypothetical protein [Lacticaseibacillus paracasei]MDB1563641.1 hypothetical protein [Lacticaseibacillus paracasei]